MEEAKLSRIKKVHKRLRHSRRPCQATVVYVRVMATRRNNVIFYRARVSMSLSKKRNENEAHFLIKRGQFGPVGWAVVTEKLVWVAQEVNNEKKWRCAGSMVATLPREWVKSHTIDFERVADINSGVLVLEIGELSSPSYNCRGMDEPKIQSE